MRTITTTSLTGKALTIRCGWITKETTIWADGDEVTVPEKRFELAVMIDGIGEVLSPRLVHKATELERKIGINKRDTYTIEGEIIYQGQRRQVVVQIDDEAYNAIKAEEDLDKAKEAIDVVTYPAPCPRCGTYCYGDCEVSG